MSIYKSKICRICLKGGSDINIFSTRALNDSVVNLLTKFADVMVFYDHPLPHVICKECLERLTLSCQLRKQIRRSDVALREMYMNGAEQEIVECKKEDFEFSLNADVKFSIKSTSPLSPNDFIGEAQTPPPTKESVDIDSEEYLAAWILNQTPKLPEPEPLSTETEHQCCMCRNVYSDFETLKQHAQDIHKRRAYAHPSINENSKKQKPTFDCNICWRKYNTEHTLNKHQTAYRNMVACSVCGTLILACQITTHQKTHMDDKVECDVCHKMFQRSYLTEHKANQHVGPKEWFCHMCPKKVFANKKYLLRHIRRHMSNYTKRVIGKCPQCNQIFETMSSMRIHMFIHTGKKRFTCDYCKAEFIHRTDFKRHVWTHEGSPFSCKKCNKYMDRPSHLKAHEAAGCSKSVATTRRPRQKKEVENGISTVPTTTSEETVTNILDLLQ